MIQLGDYSVGKKKTTKDISNIEKLKSRIKKEKLKKEKPIENKFLEWLTKGVNEDIRDWGFIDGFCIDNELSEKEIEYIQNLNLKVIKED